MAVFSKKEFLIAIQRWSLKINNAVQCAAKDCVNYRVGIKINRDIPDFISGNALAPAATKGWLRFFS